MLQSNTARISGMKATVFMSSPRLAALCGLDAVWEQHQGARRIVTRPLAEQAAWTGEWRTDAAGPGRWRGALRAALQTGVSRATTIGARFTFRDWSREVYVLLPGAVYAGNRFPAVASSYPPFPAARTASDPNRLPQQTQVPRLRYEDGPSVLRQMSSDPATPGIGFFFPQQRRGLWIMTPQKNVWGLFGYELEENVARDAATLTIFSPGLLREFAYEICNDRAPSRCAAQDFVAGDEVEIPLLVEEFPCESPAGLFDKLLTLRRAIVPMPTVRHDIPFSEVWRILEEHYLKDLWIEPHGYFAVGVEPLRSNTPTQNWQMGWVGGMISPHAFVLHGSPAMRERALRNFDFVFPRGQAASGYFYGTGDGTTFVGERHRIPGDRHHLVRKSGDGLFYMLSSLAAVDAAGESAKIKPHWLAGLQKCADAFVRTWDTEGQFGQFVDHDTGRILVANSASGGIVPAALVLAARRFPHRRADYLRVARAAAEHFESDYLRRGYTTGGPGDAMQCPDSESLAGLLESFVTLHEETGEARWLDAGRLAALHTASWTVSYDYEFPPDSTFGRLRMLANGTVLANAQNKHSAPGICTHSGLSLLRLFRRAGEPWMMDLLRDIAHTLPQFMSRADRPIPWTIPYFQPTDPAETTLRPGWMCERVNLTRWGEHERIGEVFYYSCWSEVSLLLTIAELPGVYAQPDTRRVWSLDHIEARWENDGLVLANPTPYPADVRVLIETSADAKQTPWPRPFVTVHVPAGGINRDLRHA
jgi:hypothetical protein